MYRIVLTLTVLIMVGLPLNKGAARGAEKLRVLIVDGNNPYHDWQVTTPLLKKILEKSGRFQVDVATLPIEQQPPGDAVHELSLGSPGAEVGSPQTAGFRPRFTDYDVVLGNYVGPRWPAETEAEFASYIAHGGGYVSVHAADNAFPAWPEYNRITGLGGWYGRDEKAGPYVYFSDDRTIVRSKPRWFWQPRQTMHCAIEGSEVRDDAPGTGGHHGQQHEYQVRIRDRGHPITRGLPPLWMHTKDELYDSLRGPAENLHVLATAYSDPETGGTGRHEPMLMTVRYGKGRVFHTVMGHADYSIQGVGFITTLLRGTEWAATGKVTIGVPDDFPTADQSRSRE